MFLYFIFTLPIWLLFCFIYVYLLQFVLVLFSRTVGRLRREWTTTWLLTRWPIAARRRARRTASIPSSLFPSLSPSLPPSLSLSLFLSPSLHSSFYFFSFISFLLSFFLFFSFFFLEKRKIFIILYNFVCFFFYTMFLSFFRFSNIYLSLIIFFLIWNLAWFFSLLLFWRCGSLSGSTTLSFLVGWDEAHLAQFFWLFSVPHLLVLFYFLSFFLSSSFLIQTKNLKNVFVLLRFVLMENIKTFVII